MDEHITEPTSLLTVLVTVWVSPRSAPEYPLLTGRTNSWVLLTPKLLVMASKAVRCVCWAAWVWFWTGMIYITSCLGCGKYISRIWNSWRGRKKRMINNKTRTWFTRILWVQEAVGVYSTSFQRQREIELIVSSWRKTVPENRNSVNKYVLKCVVFILWIRVYSRCQNMVTNIGH